MNQSPAEQFWSYCRDSQFRLQQCRKCRLFRYPPRSHCAACGESGARWTDSSGRAALVTYAVYRRDFESGLEVPYVIGLVELAEGPRMITRLTGCAPGDVRIGMPLVLEFENSPEGQPLPLFRPF